MRTSVMAPVVALAVALLTVGCSGGGQVNSPATSGHPVEGRSSATASADSNSSSESGALPLDAYTQDNSQSDAIEQATNELIAQCMRAKGFTVPPLTPLQQAIQQESNSVTADSEPYGITSLTQAAQYGYSAPVTAAMEQLRAKYHLGNFGPHATVGPDSGIFAPKESPAYNIALMGYASGIPPVGYDTVKGCTGRAYDELDGGPTPVDPHSLVGSLAGTAEQQTQSDPRVQRALAAWSSCMRGRGYSYQTPMQAASESWPDSATPLEISTAKADVLCKQRVNLPSLWQSAEAGYERTLITQNAVALAQVKQRISAEVGRAETVLRRGS
jgi:hypothetical protein